MNVFLFFLHTYISPTHHTLLFRTYRYFFDFIFKYTTQNREPDERFHFRVGFYAEPTQNKTNHYLCSCIVVASFLYRFICIERNEQDYY